jgi:hypothetical protein
MRSHNGLNATNLDLSLLWLYNTFKLSSLQEMFLNAQFYILPHTKNFNVIFSCLSRLGSLVDWVKGHNITVVKLDCRIKVMNTNSRKTELLKNKGKF